MGWSVLEGDALERLRELPDGSVQTCVTSPPYWGLRDYGTDGQLGLEPTPEEYVASLVAVFREVKRVLRDDGTLWLNLGDSYNAYNGNRGTASEYAGNREEREPIFPSGHGLAAKNLKQKDLVGIPWMVAFALRADGWYLRSDIIWAKPNPMPESVTDRPTKSHEYLFLLSKAPRYYYDAVAIREDFAAPEGPWGGRTPREGVDVNGGGQASEDGFREYLEHGGRNRRSVWTITTRPFPGAHFAVFPPELVEPCVLAGSPPQACGECGAPWLRVTRRERTRDGEPLEGSWAEPGAPRALGPTGVGHWRDATRVETLRWEASCAHGDGSGRATVLDPFCGAGTAGLVALRLDRDFIGIELSPVYAELARERIRADAPLLNVPAER